MELVVDPAHRALRFARTLRVPQEALRLGSNVVASEHLLMATLCDPVIRWKLKVLGTDMREVQVLVARATATRGTCGDHRFVMTRAAATLIVDAAATTGLDPDQRPDPAMFSAAMIALMTTLLRNETDTTARAILTELAVLEQTAWLLDALHHSLAASTALTPRLL